VEQAIRQWVHQLTKHRRDILAIGYFGSYARGDWGVGSDLDIVIIVKHAERPFTTRAAVWDTTDLPVPVDLVVYTLDEWQGMLRTSPWVRTIAREAVWVYGDTCALTADLSHAREDRP